MVEEAKKSDVEHKLRALNFYNLVKEKVQSRLGFELKENAILSDDEANGVIVSFDIVSNSLEELNDLITEINVDLKAEGGKLLDDLGGPNVGVKQKHEPKEIPDIVKEVINSKHSTPPILNANKFSYSATYSFN